MSEITKQNTNENISLKGNILLFSAFDLGDEIDLKYVKKRGLVESRAIPLSPYFKNYHIPLSFTIDQEGVGGLLGADCILSKLHHFGAVSFCYKLPFEMTFAELEKKSIELDDFADRQSREVAQKVFERIMPAIRKPYLSQLFASYMVIQVDPSSELGSPEDLIKNYGGEVARLLRFESRRLSPYQIADTLASRTGYYGSDCIVIDSQGAFVYDAEYFDSLEFFELANIQKLQLQYFDRLLNRKLNEIYHKDTFDVPWTAYIPFLGRKFSLSGAELAKLRVDVSVITEQLEGSIALVGDPFYSNLYEMLVENLSLEAWKKSIDKKLVIIGDIFTFYNDILGTIHGEILEFVIILLIAAELFHAFAH